MAAVQCQWSEEMERLLICFYAEHQCLWNVKAKVYRNRDLKKKAFDELCQQLSNEQQVVNAEDVKKKFKNLRTVFMREHGLVSDSSRSGAGTAEVYVPKWKHFKSLMFLRDSCIPDESSDNMDKPESEPSSSAPSQTPDNATPLSPQPQPSETPTKKKTDKKATENKAVEAMDYALDFLKRKATSPHATFFQYLETILESLPENKVKRLKREIMNLALRAEEEE